MLSRILVVESRGFETKFWVFIWNFDFQCFTRLAIIFLWTSSNLTRDIQENPIQFCDNPGILSDQGRGKKGDLLKVHQDRPTFNVPEKPFLVIQTNLSQQVSNWASPIGDTQFNRSVGKWRRNKKRIGKRC